MWLGLEDPALWPRTCSLEFHVPSEQETPLALTPGLLRMRASLRRGSGALLFRYPTRGSFSLWVPRQGQGPPEKLRFYRQSVRSLLKGTSSLRGSVSPSDSGGR